MSRADRVILAVIVGILSLAIIATYHLSNEAANNDLFFPLCGGRAELAGIDPYGGSCEISAIGRLMPTNPMTTILISLPFAPFGDDAALVIWGIMSGLLAYGLTREGKAWPLLVFLSAPYWYALFCLNWTPLMASLAMLPALTPLWLVKPHNGLPAFIIHFTWKRAGAALLFLVFSIIIDPTWPLRWWPQAQRYDAFIPLLLLPFGPLILCALPFWRDLRVRFLLLLSAMPQRYFYDPLLLYWIPDSLIQLIILLGTGWIGYVLAILLSLPYFQVIVLFFYLPAVALRLYSLRFHVPKALHTTRGRKVWNEVTIWKRKYDDF